MAKSSQSSLILTSQLGVAESGYVSLLAPHGPIFIAYLGQRLVQA